MRRDRWWNLRYEWLLTAFVVAVIPTETGAYEVETHAAVSAVAVNESALNLPEVVSRLGLRALALDDRRQTFLTSRRDARTIRDLIQFGSRWEDDRAAEQALRHFYDPVNDRPLDLGGDGAALIVKSPDWALEDTQSFSTQESSYSDARNQMYEAITGATEVARRKSFGSMFQAIGHVIHHLQDMAQPQHVRNDPHCDKWICKKLYPRVYAPSQYEKYTDLASPNDPLRQIRINLPFRESGSSAVYPGANPADIVFKKPRDFWRTTAPGSSIDSGKGIAEYTNRNFFSAATTFTPYNAPHPGTVSDWYAPTDTLDIQQLLSGTPLRGTIRFFGRPVTDALTGQSDTNPRALSDALLDADLAEVYSTTGTGGYLVFALNRFTFDTAHRYLIPRAVAYSAGLINYFFRGQLDIRQPDEGAYAILDHAVDNQRDVSGFRKLKVKLKNATPGGTDSVGNSIVEPIPEGSTGSFIAVVKFHRNNCYQPDLSGEYGSPGMDWHACRSPIEEIVTSAPVPVRAGINESLQPYLFDFAPRVVPVNATDVFLQIVYRGQLGEETDAVIVATKDISEPTYNYLFNTWDQSLYCSNGVISSDPPCAQVFTFEQSFCQQAAPELTLAQCRARNGRTAKVRANPTGNPLPGFDPSNPAVPADELIYDMSREPPLDPLFALPTPVGSFTRVAVLTDLAPADRYIVINELGVSDMTTGFIWSEGTVVPTINQLDAVSGTMIRSRSYANARGVFVDTTPYEWNPSLSDYLLLTGGNAPAIPVLDLIPSQILDF